MQLSRTQGTQIVAACLLAPENARRLLYSDAVYLLSGRDPEEPETCDARARMLGLTLVYAQVAGHFTRKAQARDYLALGQAGPGSADAAAYQRLCLSLTQAFKN